MKWLAAVLLAASPALLAQRNVSPTGFGRILFPGGTAPGGVGGIPTFNGNGRLLFPGGAVPGGVGGRLLFPGTAALPYAPQAYGRPSSVGHGSHAPGYVVPYPVFYGGGYYGVYQPYGNYIVPEAPTAQTAQPVNIQQNYPPPSGYGSYSEPAGQQPPVVIINQYFREQSAPATSTGNEPPPVETQPQQQTEAAPPSNEPPIFLIAMKDHTVFTASAYWIEDDTLHYITTQGSENSASMDLIDRDLSRRLNRERNVAFGLPAN